MRIENRNIIKDIDFKMLIDLEYLLRTLISKKSKQTDKEKNYSSCGVLDI